MQELGLSLRNHLSSPVALLALFLLVTEFRLSPSSGSAGGCSTRIVRSRTSVFASVEAAALVARDVERSLASWNDLLAPAARGGQVTLPHNAVMLVLDSQGVVQQQGMRLPFYPMPSSAPHLTRRCLQRARHTSFAHTT